MLSILAYAPVQENAYHNIEFVMDNRTAMMIKMKKCPLKRIIAREM
jgi:hypothetical protein